MMKSKCLTAAQQAAVTCPLLSTLTSCFSLFCSLCFHQGAVLPESFFFLVYLRERVHRAQRERQRESENASRLCTTSTETNEGLKLTNREIVTRPEIKSWTLSARSHPDAPCILNLLAIPTSGPLWLLFP